MLIQKTLIIIYRILIFFFKILKWIFKKIYPWVDDIVATIFYLWLYVIIKMVAVYVKVVEGVFSILYKILCTLYYTIVNSKSFNIAFDYIEMVLDFIFDILIVIVGWTQAYLKRKRVKKRVKKFLFKNIQKVIDLRGMIDLYIELEHRYIVALREHRKGMFELKISMKEADKEYRIFKLLFPKIVKDTFWVMGYFIWTLLGYCTWQNFKKLPFIIYWIIVYLYKNLTWENIKFIFWEIWNFYVDFFGAISWKTYILYLANIAELFFLTILTLCWWRF